jgi:aldose 1-epimerase
VSARIDERDEEGFPAVALTSADGRLTASFVPSLNMIGSSLVHEGEDLLYRRAGLSAYAENAKTCGLPLLHPWANRVGADRYEAAGRRVEIRDGAAGIHRDANGLAIHGLVGGRTAWEITERRADAGGALVRSRLRFDAPDLLASFPFPHTVEIAATVRNDSLEIATVIEPHAGHSVPVSFGWHPYFRLPSPRESWLLTLPVSLHVELDARSLPAGNVRDVGIAPSALGARTFDDLFTGIAPSRAFVIEDATRRIEIELGEGYPFVQVWAPEASPFLCIEPMTAAVNALADRRFSPPVVTAPATFRATFTIRITRPNR